MESVAMLEQQEAFIMFLKQAIERLNVKIPIAQKDKRNRGSHRNSSRVATAISLN